MRATRLAILHLLAVAFAVWAATSLDAWAGALEAIVFAAISGQESSPAVQALAGEWVIATSLLDLAAMIPFLALLAGGLPLAFVGLVIDRARRHVPRLVEAGRPVYYGCLVFQVTSMLMSAFWLMPLILTMAWHGLGSTGLVPTYLIAQFLASLCVLPAWRRLSQLDGSHLLVGGWWAVGGR
jgi:hypothetical protein